METSYLEEDLSDEEIFFGKLTLKEIKRMFCKKQESPKVTYDTRSKNNPNASLRLIETHSQPNLRCTEDSPIFSSNHGSPAPVRKSDESFIEMENMVSKLCTSRNSDNVELNNTLEVIDYILINGPTNNKVQEPVKKYDNEEESKAKPIVDLKIEISPKKDFTPVKENLKLPEKTEINVSPNYYTPSNSVIKKQFNHLNIPSSSSNESKTPMFKTPLNPSSRKMPLTPRNTPGRTNAYKHIASPIASYIKNCPQAPLVKDVYPKKPLPGTSSIPKLVKKPSHSKIPLNRSNANLPSVAYKSAKKTVVIQAPDENKLPNSKFVQKMSLTKHTVIKHEKREMNPVKKRLLLNQEESFNLSCNQAEVSYCTQKSAFKPTYKH